MKYIFILLSIIIVTNTSIAAVKKGKKKKKVTTEQAPPPIIQEVKDVNGVQDDPPPMVEPPIKKEVEAVHTQQPRVEKEPEGIIQALCKVGTPLGDYRIIQSDRSDYFTKSLPKDKYFIMVLFNPTCDHCQRQAKLLQEAQKTVLSNTVVAYVTGQMMIDMLPEFQKKIDYTPKPNFIVGVDTYDFVTNLFEYKYLPQLIIYSKDKKVMKVFHKETELEKILEYIK